jgi:phospholipid/cholesterol/gamma-HCH transport system substrate-binding protein
MKGHSLAELATGAVVLLVAAAFLGYAVLQGGRGPTAQGMSLTAAFDRVDGLVNGADVRIGGVKVGSVTEMRIDPQNFLALVTLRIRPDLRLPADSSAEIASDGLLGGKHVAIVPGGADRVLADGGRISDTQGSISLESLLGRFIFSVTQINQGGGAAPADPPAGR